MAHALLWTSVAAGEEETQALATALAKACGRGDCILLQGDLGVGKTTFARGFIHALGEKDEEVVSPTFTLVQTYPTKEGWPVWHFDLYRLKRREELDQLGLEEALATGVTLIEWPDLAEGKIPSQALTVRIAYGSDKRTREVALLGDAVWKERLKRLP